MAIELLNGTLLVDVFVEHKDIEFDDNICVCLKEYGPDDEKILYANETYVYLTDEQARDLAQMLISAADQSSHTTR